MLDEMGADNTEYKREVLNGRKLTDSLYFFGECEGNKSCVLNSALRYFVTGFNV